MKVYGQLEKAQIENLTADPTGANLVVGLVWFRTDLNLHRWYNGTIVQEAVDLASLQTLINKTLTAPAISDPAISGVSTYDEVVATPATPAAGKAKLYLKDDGLFYKLDPEGNEIPVGSGSGGGLDVFHTEDFEINNAADFSSGNNATFLGGGALQGTLADEIVSQISGNRSLKYTQAAGSLNDFFASPAFDIDNKQSGNDVSVTLYFEYDGDINEIAVVVYDATNSDVISDNIDLLESADNPNRFSTSIVVPDTCTSIRWGAHVIVENIGAILKLDDIEFSMSPEFIYDLEDSESARFDTITGYSSNNTKIPYYTNGYDQVFGRIMAVLNTAADGLSIEALIDCDVDMHIVFNGTSGDVYGGSKNASVGQLDTAISSLGGTEVSLGSGRVANTNGMGSVPISVRLKKGDIIRPHYEGGSINVAARHSVSIVAKAAKEHVVIPSKSGKNDFGARIANNGTSTISSQTDDFITSVNRVSVGRTTITFKSNFFSEIPAIEATGDSATFPANCTWRNLTAASVDIYTYDASGTSQDLDFTVSVQRQGDDVKDAKALSAFPVEKTVWIKDIKATTTDGGDFNTGARRTRDLNTLEGATYLVELSSNQFRFKKIGRYKIRAIAPAFSVDAHQAWLVNTTAVVDEIVGVGGTSSASNFVQNASEMVGEIEVTDTADLYEIQHECDTTQAGNGFGVGNAFGGDIMYTYVEITKVK